MKNETKKLTQKELEARAFIAGDLLRESIVTRVETFRVEMDAAIGENTGELKFQRTQILKMARCSNFYLPITYKYTL